MFTQKTRMTNSDTEPQFNRDEFTKIFDEYRSRIEEITRQTEQNLQAIRTPVEIEQDIAEEETAEIEPGTADGPAEETTAIDADAFNESIVETPEAEPPEDVVPEAQAPVTEPHAAAFQEPETPVMVEPQPPVRESEKIIREAEKKAKKIIDETENQVRKEAKKKTKTQVEKILEQARREAEAIIARANEIVEREKNSAIEASKTQTEQLLKDISEEFRRETQTKASQTINEARDKADKLITEAVSSGKEISSLLREMVERAHTTIDEFESRIQQEAGDISKAITDVQMKIEQLTMAAEEPAYIPPPENENGEYTEPMTPSLTMHILGDRSNGKNGTQPLFFGKVEMRSDSASFDYQYFKNVKKQFTRIPSIKQLEESASEKEISALFDITEPLPLLEILGNMPQVSEVINETERDISIVFKQPA